MNFIPKSLDEFIINNEIAKNLTKYTSSTIPNILMYGLNNVGKKTLTDNLLNHIFMDDVVKKKKINQTEIRIGNNKVEIDYISSLYHIEINLYEYGLYDKDILTDFIYDLISNQSINSHPFKILVINHIDKISPCSQLILRRMMDKCSKTARFILICEDLSKLNDALISRFSLIRVPKVNNDTIKNYISYVSKKYHKLTSSQQNRILNTCNNDIYLLNQIIMATINNPKFNFSKVEDVNRDIYKIYRLTESNNISSVLEIRSICYNLLLLNYSMKELFNSIYMHFLQKIPKDSIPEFLEYAANINHHMGYVEHDIICIEYLILKVKKELLSNK